MLPPVLAPSSIGWALVPTVIVAILEKGLADWFVEPRMRYLTYELVMLILGLMFLWVVVPRRAARASTDPRVATWLRHVTCIVIAHYAGWIIADVLILTGHPWGHVLRIIPNAIYYALFLPLTYMLAPRDLVGRDQRV